MVSAGSAVAVSAAANTKDAVNSFISYGKTSVKLDGTCLEILPRGNADKQFYAHRQNLRNSRIDSAAQSWGNLGVNQSFFRAITMAFVAGGIFFYFPPARALDRTNEVFKNF